MIFGKKKKSKLKFLLILLTISIIVVALTQFGFVGAMSSEEINSNFESSISDQLGDLDFSSLESILSSLEDDYSIFGNDSFKNKVIQIIKGEYFTNYSSIFQAILSLCFDGIVSFLPMLLIIVAITIVANIVVSIKSNVASSGVHNLINFVCFAVIITLIVTAFSQIANLTSSTLMLMKNQMDAMFPILLTLLTAVGGVASVGIYKPVVAILSGSVVEIFANVVYPLFILAFIFVIISNLTPSVKLGKFNGFLSSAFKWTVGFVFTIFSAFLTIQGISAGKFDGISIKTAKFAMKSYIPIVGGYLSDGIDFILLSSVLIKNAIGVAGLILIFLTILVPVIKIVVFKLGLQLVSSVLEPVGDGRVSNMMNSVSKILIYPIVILLSVAFMYLLSVALIMCTANVI